MLRSILPILLFAAPAVAEPGKRFAAPAPPAGFPKFEVEEIDVGLKIGYAVIVADVDGDKKPDIVVVDQHKVVWYQNPTWKKRTILDGKTKPDNVCIAAVDIDGDGLPEFILGAGWKPFDTKTPGTLQWLKRGKTLDDEWTMHPIPCDEPTVHRIRVADIINGKPVLILAPLMGRDATKEKNWMDGRPVRIMAYAIPAKEPEKGENWKSAPVCETLHVVHNFFTLPDPTRHSLLYASYEGVSAGSFTGDGFETRLLHSANQADPKGSRGGSEIRATRRAFGGKLTIATVEPWHGSQVVVYRPLAVSKAGGVMDRHVVDEQLRWGHALNWLESDEDAMLVAGVRDNPTKDDTFTEKRGVRLYRHDDKTKKWERFILEDGGVAVEDLAVADLDGDGKPDIVAVGRATGNARIYWNKGK